MKGKKNLLPAVLGGMAFLAAVAGLIIFFCRRERR